MKKDKRQIKLDPMEWRDAMRDVVKKADPPATKGKVKKATRSGSRGAKGR